MGRLTTLAGPVYLDTNVFIYALEGLDAFSSELAGLFSLIQTASLQAVTSELTLAEVLVKPLSNNRTDLCSMFEETLRTSAGLQMVPITREILLNAAQLRAMSGVKLPDAIHIATALTAGCSTFLTNDKDMAIPSELGVVYLSEVASDLNK